MKQKIIFATNNKHKLEEIRKILDARFDIVSLSEIEFQEEIPETQDTIEGNALQKANYIFDRYSLPVFADDTGLEIQALDGDPGVYSARYAGPACSFEDNCNKVLKNLQGEKNRKARFKTVIAYKTKTEETCFEGIVEGNILEEFTGNNGFGYDPIFLPVGFNESFAEMSMDQKNAISHRGRAVAKLAAYLQKDK